MSGRTKVIIAAAVLAVLWLAGSIAYWVAEGSPGTPAEFRARVAETGLVVDWTNNGGRGGDGTVETDCGPIDVTVNLFPEEDTLYLTTPGQRSLLDDQAIALLLACEGFDPE